MYIETPRMIIRNFTLEDASDLHDILGDSETMANCEPAYDFEKTKQFLTSFCIHHNGAVAAVYKQSGKVIGYILFNEINPNEYELGWFFNRNFWQQGYAFETCKAVIDYAFHTLNARKIFAETIDTVKSVSLMKKLGMQLEDIQQIKTRDTDINYTDLYLYAILKQDWK